MEIVSKSIGSTTVVNLKAPEERHRILYFHLEGDETSTALKKVIMDKAVLYGKAMAQSKLG
jgi:hypothetical protein